MNSSATEVVAASVDPSLVLQHAAEPPVEVTGQLLGGRLRDLLAGKKVLLTGVTGFIGEQLLWKILTELPDTTPAVLVRRKGSAGAEQRMVGGGEAGGYGEQAFSELLPTLGAVTSGAGSLNGGSGNTTLTSGEQSMANGASSISTPGSLSAVTVSSVLAEVKNSTLKGNSVSVGTDVQTATKQLDGALAAGTVGVGGGGRGQAVQLVLDALALGLGGMQGAADVLAGVLVAKVADRQAAGLTADVVAAPGPQGVLCGGVRVVQRALQATLKVAHELLELAHDAGQGRRLGGGRFSRFGVAGSSVSLQQGHWGAVAGCGRGGGQCGRRALGGRATAAQGEGGGVAQGR